ncbi:hypothetical protein F0562_022264 [Nyssa sinensis]|uniref:Uncharacterized protein n=1 Tax=Nyssa sinensis TaxID=561372 RepID=A0A5J5BR69_9ASTE|nr:hypothetical protein F0562_022264 [Nyssa sinensis]
MASPEAEEIHAAPPASDPKYRPAALTDGELEDPELNNFQVDPESTTSKEFKEEAEAAKKANKDGVQTLKAAVIFSGIAVVVVGAIFAIVKKLRKA